MRRGVQNGLREYAIVVSVRYLLPDAHSFLTPSLLNRALDPLLGVFTGVLAYYMAEANPRTAPPREESLGELLRWKRDKWRRQKAESNSESETDLILEGKEPRWYAHSFVSDG